MSITITITEDEARLQREEAQEEKGVARIRFERGKSSSSCFEGNGMVADA